MHAGHDLGVKFNTPVANSEELEEEKEEIDEAGEDRLGSRQSEEKKKKPYFKRYNFGSEGWSLKN